MLVRKKMSGLHDTNKGAEQNVYAGDTVCRRLACALFSTHAQMNGGANVVKEVRTLYCVPG